MAKFGKIALFSVSAWLFLGLAAAGAQQTPPAKAGASPTAARPARAGSSMNASLPAQDEAQLRKDHPELYVLPPVSHAYKPARTSWGDPDISGMWPVDSIGGLALQRSPAMGNRVWLTDAEYAVVSKRMEASREAPAKETKAGKLGMGNWVEMTGAGRRTSMLIDPANGRLPELTPEGKRLTAIGRSSWIRGQTFDWVTDFDSWDRCITRGFPASMLPFRYNNGVQIMQAPNYVVINLEMIHDARIIPLDGRPAMAGTTNWMGESRGHWEGDTLVVETDHIRSGAAPLNMATIGAPFGNTIPMSPQAHVTERFTPVGPNTLTYEMTYSDPVIWTAPFTLRVDWTRNPKYKFYEYACHEGDVQVRNYIHANRAQRAKDKALAQAKASAQPASTPAAHPKTPAQQRS
ncbi:MAG TPA: hypothetical protein VHX64_08900 [Caulobacteraceae bacterium]|nr:hypothetical protein [Caulobacteraceae bacterium]